MAGSTLPMDWLVDDVRVTQALVEAAGCMAGPKLTPESANSSSMARGVNQQHLDTFELAAMEFASLSAPAWPAASRTAGLPHTASQGTTDLLSTIGDSLTSEMDALWLDSEVMDSMHLLKETMFPNMSVSALHSRGELQQNDGGLRGAVSTFYSTNVQFKTLLHDICSSAPDSLLMGAALAVQGADSLETFSPSTLQAGQVFLPHKLQAFQPPLMAESISSFASLPDRLLSSVGSLDVGGEDNQDGSELRARTRKLRSNSLCVRSPLISKVPSKIQGLLKEEEATAPALQRCVSTSSAATSQYEPTCSGSASQPAAPSTSEDKHGASLTDSGPPASKAKPSPARYASVIRSSPGGKPRSSKAAKVPAAKQRNRSAPSFNDILRLGLLTPGQYDVLVGNVDTVKVTVTENGQLLTHSARFSSISAFALSVLKQRNPERLACDGWKEVKVNGVKLEALRLEASRILAIAGCV